MKNLIVWSGGFDSTAILLDIIKSGNEFETIYFKSENIVDNKTEAEIASRDKIKRILKDFNNITFKDHIRECYTMHRIKNSLILNFQMHMWMMNLFYFLNTKTTYDYVQFGYITTDKTFWRYHHSFLKTYKYMSQLLAIDEPPEIWLPFKDFDKKQIYKNYYAKGFVNQKIFKEIWTCEFPIKRKSGKMIKCGKCNKCKEIKTIA